MNDGANTMCSLFLYFLLFSWLISPLRAKEMTHVAAISQWVVACRCNQHVRWVLIVAASYSCTAKANIGYFFVISVTLLLTLHIFLIRECLFVSTHRNNTTTTITQYRRTYPFTDRWSTYNYHFCPFLHFIPFPFACSSLLLYFFFFLCFCPFSHNSNKSDNNNKNNNNTDSTHYTISKFATTGKIIAALYHVISRNVLLYLRSYLTLMPPAPFIVSTAVFAATASTNFTIPQPSVFLSA